MLDSNEDIKKNGTFKLFVDSNQFVDAIQIHNPNHAINRPTFIRSSNRIDYILVTRDLLPFITKAGHYDFHQLFLSTDHRGIYMSLKTEHLFDSSEYDPTRIENRKLQLHKRDHVENYLKHLKKMFVENKFWERTLSLLKKFDECKEASTQKELIKTFDQMDREKTTYMLSAEKRLKPSSQTGLYEWSPLLEKAGRTFTYWKACHHLRSLNVPEPPSLKKIQQNLGILSTSNSKAYICHKYQSAKSNLKKIQQKAKEHQESHLHKLAEHYASTQNSTKATELKQIIRNEKIRNIAKKHRWYFMGNNHGNVPYLLVPKSNSTSDDQYEIIYDPPTIHHHLLQRNKSNLTKTKNTPFNSEPLNTMIGIDGENSAVDDILNGTFDTSNIDDPDLVAFIGNLKKAVSNKSHTTTPDLDPTITVEEFKKYLKKTRESTASSSSGLHYGHYIAGAESDFIITILLTFMQSPFQYGFTLTCWENSIHCMLQKETLPYLHRLQIVQLYEADFNSYMKIVIGRKLTYHAENHLLLGDQAHGNRPNRST